MPLLVATYAKLLAQKEPRNLAANALQFTKLISKHPEALDQATTQATLPPPCWMR